MKENVPIPPKLAVRFLNAFLRHDLIDEVRGDLEEKFYLILETQSPFRAKLNYWYQVLQYVRPFAIRKSMPAHLNPYDMYRSYFKTAFRSMIKNKLHAFINIAGLSAGMAVAIAIGLWVDDELSFEKNFEHYDRIGQVIQNVTNNGEVQTWRTVPFPLSEEIRKNYGSDFKYVALVSGRNDHLLSTETKKLTRTGIYAEPDFTEMFTLKMVKGSRNAITDQSSVLISASAARAFFGDNEPVGEVMMIDQKLTVHVAGVYEDIPFNSEFTNVDFISSWELLYNSTDWIKTMQDPWRPNAFQLYVELADHASFNAASARIKDAKLKNLSKELAKKKPELFIHPMSKWHLYSQFKNGKQDGGRIQYVWLFGIVGVFVVLMACINFMNLSTARSENRAREVGIRKVVGSYRAQLIAQFFSESILTALVSLATALIIVHVMLPFFNEVSEKHLILAWGDPVLWVTAFAFCVLIGLVAGSYPAFYLSSIRTVSVLKGVFRAGRSASLARKILVVIQFTVSVVLIIGTAIVFKQIQFAKNRPIGYATDGLIFVTVRSMEIHNHFEAIKTELQNKGAIVAMAEAESPTTELWSSSSGFDWDGKDPDLSVDFPKTAVSTEYGKTIGWELKEGRDFSRDFISDTTALIINETAAQYMGLKNPIGQTIRWFTQPYRVIGVIKDIVNRSPYEASRPNIYFLSRESENFVILKLSPKAVSSDAIALIESTFKRFESENPFSYKFADTEYALKFGSEERIGTLATIFSTLAIFISCLGMFGLSSFVAEQRTKEIGIRKVMGATLYNLWALVSRDFLFPVVLSCIIAIPVSYNILSAWLEKYQYRISFPLWIFTAASVLTLLITLVTVSWHTLHAATRNPVKSLRSE